jgi:hypothetical protein
LFDSPAAAQSAVQELANSGFDRNDISLVANDARGEYRTYTGGETSAAGEGAAAGAVGGGVLGGVLGLLVGVGALAIPGIGPVLAAGPLAAALGTAGASTLVGAGIGAATGGIVGALVGAGIPEEDAHFYAEGVRRGGTLVMAKTSDEMANNAYTIMQRAGAVDVDERSGAYRSSGWERFDDTAQPYNGTTDMDDKWERSSKAGTASGALAGAATGAAVGAAGGPVGAVVGGAVGAAAGAGVGAAGDVAGESIEEGVEHHHVNHTEARNGATNIDDKWERSSKAGTAGGALAGAATGAAMGSVGGPVGAVVGGVAGAATGAGVGAAGDVAGESIEGSFDTYDADFRTHYNSYAADRGYTYDQYQPVYQYGYTLATNPTYRDRDWDAIETDARYRWEERNPGTWEEFKDAVRYAWDKARGYR